MEMSNIDLLKEFYKKFNLRGVLDEKNKIKIDKSLNRLPEKIGDKVDKILYTIFNSKLKDILENKEFRTNCKEKINNELDSFFLKKNIYKTMFKLNGDPFSKIAITFYLYYIKSSNLSAEELIAPMSEEESVIDNIFRWFEEKYPQIESWGVDNKNLYDWRKIKNPKIIGVESILKLKNDLKRDFPEIISGDLEHFGVLLFFGRVIRSDYLREEKMNAVDKYMKGKINYREFFFKKKEEIEANFSQANLKKKEMNQLSKKSNMSKKISKIYDVLDIEFKKLEQLNYEEVKIYFEELRKNQGISGQEKVIYLFKINYILAYALENKDEIFSKKIYANFSKKIKLTSIEKRKNILDRDTVLLKIAKLLAEIEMKERQRVKELNKLKREMKELKKEYQTFLEVKKIKENSIDKKEFEEIGKDILLLEEVLKNHKELKIEL